MTYVSSVRRKQGRVNVPHHRRQLNGSPAAASGSGRRAGMVAAGVLSIAMSGPASADQLLFDNFEGPMLNPHWSVEFRGNVAMTNDWEFDVDMSRPSSLAVHDILASNSQANDWRIVEVSQPISIVGDYRIEAAIGWDTEIPAGYPGGALDASQRLVIELRSSTGQTVVSFGYGDHWGLHAGSRFADTMVSSFPPAVGSLPLSGVATISATRTGSLLEFAWDGSTYFSVSDVDDEIAEVVVSFATFDPSPDRFTPTSFLGTLWIDSISVEGVSPAPSCAAPPSDLVMWLPGDSNAADLWGAHDGILMSGAAAGIPGFVDGAFSFDGSGAHVLIEDAPGLDFDEEFTVEAFVRPDTLTFSNGVGTILSKWQSAGDARRSFVFGVYDGGSLFLMVSDGTADEFVVSNSTIVVDEYSFVAATFDRGSVSFYVNGIYETHSVSISSIGETDNPLTSGVRLQQNGNHLIYSGEIDELRAFDRALSEAELLETFGAGGSGSCKDALPTEDESELVTLRFKEHPNSAGDFRVIARATVENPPVGADVLFEVDLYCPNATISRSCIIDPASTTRDVYLEATDRLVCQFDTGRNRATARLLYKDGVPYGSTCSAYVKATSGVYRLLQADLSGTLIQ